MKIKEINAAFEALHWAFDNQTVNWADRLFEKCKEEEREHRGFLPDFTRCHEADTITTSQAARLFAVKRIAEYLRGEKYPQGKDYLHCQKSCFIAAGMVDEFAHEINRAWEGLDVQALAELNYTDFVRVRKAVAA